MTYRNVLYARNVTTFMRTVLFGVYMISLSTLPLISSLTETNSQSISPFLDYLESICN
jgi:hypothetical protein